MYKNKIDSIMHMYCNNVSIIIYSHDQFGGSYYFLSNEENDSNLR